MTSKEDVFWWIGSCFSYWRENVKI